MNKPPAFPFYAKDWLSSSTVRTMPLWDVGVYIQLLAAAWDSEEPGTLPADVREISRVTGIDPRVLRKFFVKYPGTFPEVAGRLVNFKLRVLWLEMKQRKEKQSDAGKKGNETRWRKPSQPDSPPDRFASAFAFASAVKDLEPRPDPDPPCAKFQQPERPPDKTRRSPSPLEIESKNKTLARLIICAKEIREREKRSGVALDEASFKEELKCLAAKRDISYTGDLVAQAHDILRSRDGVKTA